MDGEFLAVIAVLIIGFALVAHKLERWHISPPMAFLVAGVVVFGWVADVAVTDHQIRLIAEVTLVVVLFHDASSVRIRSLRHHPGVPLRLLLIGFPLALLFTFGTAQWLLPSIGFAGALLLAGALTPTDAGLGADTILNPEVPNRIRRALNMESGLNDGLATPIVLLALSLLASDEGVGTPTILQISVVPVALALVLSVAVGLALAYLLDLSQARGLSSNRGRALAVLAIPLLLWGAAELIGANGFIAAFVGGLVFGARSGCLHEGGEAAESLEVAADLLSFVIWFLAGGLMVAVLSIGYDWRWLVLAVLALTLLRMVPVALSLIGSGVSGRAVLFLGWFGPRGLATIVFVLLAVEELEPDATELQPIVGVCLTAVVLSVFAHGISAQPLAVRFGRWSRGHGLEPLPADMAPARTRGRPSRLHQQ